jgi:hypothetical protein
MILAFYHDHGGLADAWMLGMAVEHAARVHPEAHILHLTTPGGPPTPAPAERVTIDHRGEFAERRCFAHAMATQHFGPEVLFLDTDCHLLAPVDDIWAEEFDVAATVMQRPLHPMLPCNSGVVYTRNQHFWWDLADMNAGIVWTPGAPTWMKLEENFNRLLTKRKYRVHWLPGSVYNRIPTHRNDILGAAVVHWKGNLKELVRPS